MSGIQCPPWARFPPVSYTWMDRCQFSPVAPNGACRPLGRESKPWCISCGKGRKSEAVQGRKDLSKGEGIEGAAIAERKVESE